MPVTAQAISTLNIVLKNGVRLDFQIEDGKLLGLSQVIIDDIPLIVPGNIRQPYVETRDGWMVDQLVLLDLSQRSNGTQVLECEAWARKPPMGRKLDMFQFPFIGTPFTQPQRIGTMRWLIHPVTQAIGDPAVRQHVYQGFSYQYEFELDRPFHWILDAGTWEAGGKLENIHILSKHMHCCAGEMEATLPREDKSYSTAESFMPKVKNNITTVPDMPADPSLGYILPIQAQVRGAGGSLIDAQYTDQAMVFGYFQQTGYYRTLIEWRTGDPGIGHLDHHFFELTKKHTTVPKFILAEGIPNITRTQAINRWTDVWEHVAMQWRNQAGVTREDPIISYSMPWINNDPCWGHAPDDMFQRIENQLDWMQEHGFNCMYSGLWGNHRGNDMPDTANACEPDDFLVHPRHGGGKAFAHLCKQAHQRGIKVSMWISFHLSLRGPTLKAHPDWVIHYDTNAPWDGNYRIMASCSLRSGYRDWLLDQLRQLKAHGLDMLFIDSYNNLAACPIDYGDPCLPPGFVDLLEFQGECKKIGLDCMIETVGPIGTTSCGFWPQYLQSLELGYWSHYRFRKSMLDDGTIDESIYFRFIANKAPLGGVSVVAYSHQPQPPAPQLPAYLSTLNNLYLQLKDLMQVRTLNEDGSISWLNPAIGEGCLFAIDTGSITVPVGFDAVPVYNTQQTFGPGKHQFDGLAAFKLVRHV